MVMLESFSLILCVLYFALVLLSVIQLIRIVWNRHMLFGWQGLFLIFVFFWGAVRGFFFLFIDELDEFDDAWVIYFLYWLPINIQFATFSLLVLFYANIIYKCTDSAWWESYRAFFVAVHVVINVTVLSLILTAVVLTSAVDQSDNTLFGNSWQNMVTALISAAIFTVLITVLGYYGLKIAPLLKSGHVKIPFQPKRTSNIPILVVTFMVFIIFLSRAIFNVLSAFGVVSLPVESGSSWMDFATLVVFLWWDILPILLVIMLFWRIPSSGAIRMPLLPAGGYSINGNSAGDPTLYKQPEKSSQLFDNPLRYDSPPTDGVAGLNSVLRHSLLDPHYSLTNSPYSPYSTESPHSYPSTPPTTPSTTPQQQHQVTDDSNMFGKKKKKGKSKLQVAHGGRNDSDEEHHM